MVGDLDILDLAAGFEPRSLDDWHARVEQLLKGASFDDRLVSRTADNIRVAPLYTRLEGPPDPQPGPARGPAGWDIRQAHEGTGPGSVAEAIADDIRGGVTSVTLRFAASGQTGLVPGAVGEALAGVDLAHTGVALEAGDAFPAAADALLALWRERGITDAVAQGALGADPLGAMAQAGGLARPLDELLGEAVRLVTRTRTMANVTALVANGQPYHDGGASAGLELAAMLATLVAYLRACEDAAIDTTDALAGIAVGLAAHSDQFITIAKLRAARRLVRRIADVAGNAASARRVALTVTTSRRMLSRYDADTNILRNTLAAASAAMSGAQAITILPHTARLGRGDPFARRVARNIHHVLLREAHLGRVHDPAAGSYAIEKLTDDLARTAWPLFQEMEARGGMAAALASGYVQDLIGAAHATRRELIVSGRRRITGISAFARIDEPVHPLAEPSPPPVETLAVTVPRLAPRFDSAPFEALRDRVQAHQRRTGRTLRAHLVCLGTRQDHSVRAQWVTGVLAAGGIGCSGGDCCHTASGAAAQAFAESGATIAVLVASDAVYGEMGGEVAAALKSAGADAIALAGAPGPLDSALRAAGVDAFLFIGADLASGLRILLDRAGVP